MGIHQYDIWDSKKVIAGYTCDSGGLFRYNTAEDIPHYEVLAKHYGTEPGDMIRMKQQHTDTVLPVDKANGGEGVLREGFKEGCDGMITNTPGLMLCVVTADCVPVFLYDDVAGVIGMIHSGRAGTWKEIASEAVKKMQALYNSEPENIKCILGPYLCPEHHEVNKADAEPFGEHFTCEEQEEFIRISGEKAYIDMGTAIEISLIRGGLKEKNIINYSACTYENPDLFSWRRDMDPDKRILSYIALIKVES